MRISDWSSDVCSSDLETLAARRQIESHDGRFERQLVEVDDVEIGFLAGRDDAAIHEAHGLCRVGGLTLDEAGEIEATLRAITTPMGQQIGGKTRVRNETDMRPTIAKTHRSAEHTSELQSIMRISY